MNQFNQIMKQAQEMQKHLMEIQNAEFTGNSGGGMVTVVMNGKFDLKKLEIASQLLNPQEAEIISDLIIAAHNDARGKIEEAMSSMHGNMKLPIGMPGF